MPEILRQFRRHQRAGKIVEAVGRRGRDLRPQADASLLVEDTVTIAVQINGKRRDELTIARDAAKEDIESAALALDNVTRAIAGKPVRGSMR